MTQEFRNEYQNYSIPEGYVQRSSWTLKNSGYFTEEQSLMIHVKAVPNYYFLKEGTWENNFTDSHSICGYIEKADNKIQVYVRLFGKSESWQNLPFIIAYEFARVYLIFNPPKNNYAMEHERITSKFLNLLSGNS